MKNKQKPVLQYAGKVSSSSSDTVSVIIPVYNSELYLNCCLDSILAQSYETLEIILVDDGSTDASSAICDDYAKKDHRIKVIHKANGGVSSARNAGIRRATGDYFVFIDADDYINPDSIESMISCSGSDIVIAQIQQFNNQPSSHVRQLDGHTVFTMDGREAIRRTLYNKGIQNSPCAKLYSRKAVKGIFFDEKIHMAEDLLFNFMVMQNTKKVSVINRTAYYYRNNDNGAMNSTFSIKNMSALDATSYILAHVKGDELLEAAARHKHFMEACYILKRIFRSAHTYEQRRCKEVIKSMRRYVILDNQVALVNRLYAAISYLNIDLLVFLMRLRTAVGDQVRRITQGLLPQGANNE